MQYDLSAASAAQPPVPDTSGGTHDLPSSSALGELQRAVRLLEASGSYRILRRLEARPVRQDSEADLNAGRRVGIILDTETTGLDHRTDEIVEIAMIRFSYDETGIHDVLGQIEALQQPSRPLSPEICRLTGLTDAMLAGQRIDSAAIARFAADADLVIAHNAAFDRPFVEKSFPVFREKRWACSMTEVPWRSLGVEGNRLGYLLQAYGMFHAGHRALSDCQALLEILASPPPTGGRNAFMHLLHASRVETVEIRAFGAPFSAKDFLKSRGYRWSAGGADRPKTWWIQLPEVRVSEEIRFLRDTVYRREVDVPTVRLDATTRFRGS